LKLPDGEAFDLDAFTARARSKGWSNEVAQQELDEQITGLNAMGDRFREETNAHTEIGGANLEATKADVARALNKFLPVGTPERERFRKDMEQMRVGDYTPWVLFVARVGKAMREDTHVAGRSGAAPRKSLEERLVGD
jgi:hypothetical protein